MREAFTEQVIGLLRKIPSGTVSTYGDIAMMAGNPRAARQVSRILHSCASKENLPWHRVVNREGKIVLATEDARSLQISRLQAEGIVLTDAAVVCLTRYRWRGP